MGSAIEAVRQNVMQLQGRFLKVDFSHGAIHFNIYIMLVIFTLVALNYLTPFHIILSSCFLHNCIH